MIFSTTEVNEHKHMVFVSPSGVGECSTDAEHSHPVLITESGVFLQNVNEHSHELIEELPEREMLIKADKSRLKDVRNLYTDAMDKESASRESAKESREFYRGDQWPESVKAKLNEEQRAALSINLVAGSIDLLNGYFRRNRTDLRYKPVEEGDGKSADILNIVVKQVLSKNNFDMEEAEVFDDVIQVGRGAFYIGMDFDEDIRGKLKIEQYPEEFVSFGPHKRKDGSDMDYLVKWKWITLDELKSLYPDKEKEFLAVDSFISHTLDETELNNIDISDSVDLSLAADPKLMDAVSKNQRLLECEQRVYENTYTFIDSASGFRYDARNLPDAEVKSLKTIQSLDYIRQKTFRLRVTVMAAGVILSDEYVDRPENHFSVLPVYCYKYKNRYWGKIELGKDPQRELNKRRSQMTDILNRMAGSGWFMDDSTFNSNEDKQKFKQVAPRAGWVQEVADVNNPPRRQDPPVAPLNNLIAADQTSAQSFRDTTNIIPEMLGQAGRGESGVAILYKQRQGVLGNEFIFDNFNATKKVAGRLAAKYVQKYYKTRLARILMSAEDKQALTIGGQPLSSYTLQDIERFVSTMDMMDYDVIVSESQFSSTAREGNLGVLMAMAQSGIPIPPEFLMMFMDVPEKEKLMLAFKQAQQREEAKENRKYNTEIQKTQIAQQHKTGAKPEF